MRSASNRPLEAQNQHPTRFRPLDAQDFEDFEDLRSAMDQVQDLCQPTRWNPNPHSANSCLRAQKGKGKARKSTRCASPSQSKSFSACLRMLKLTEQRTPTAKSVVLALHPAGMLDPSLWSRTLAHWTLELEEAGLSHEHSRTLCENWTRRIEANTRVSKCVCLLRAINTSPAFRPVSKRTCHPVTELSGLDAGATAATLGWTSAPGLRGSRCSS